MATYALIPGGGGDPWEWHRIGAELTSRGHEAIAIRLPANDDTAGWPEYADAVVDAAPLNRATVDGGFAFQRTRRPLWGEA